MSAQERQAARAKRDALIVELARRGYSVLEISRDRGVRLTRERVYQILRELGHR